MTRRLFFAALAPVVDEPLYYERIVPKSLTAQQITFLADQHLAYMQSKRAEMIMLAPKCPFVVTPDA